MRFVRGLPGLVICLGVGATVGLGVGATGCGVDEYVAPVEVDAAPEIDAEVWEEPPPVIPDLGRAYQAIQLLVDLENRLPSRLVNGRFPDVGAASTPGATCCAAGGVTLCPPNPAAWEGVPAWDALAFRIDGEHAYVFSASSFGGTSLTVVASGDLDCDGTLSDLVMTCTITNDVVDCHFSLPAILD